MARSHCRAYRLQVGLLRRKSVRRAYGEVGASMSSSFWTVIGSCRAPRELTGAFFTPLIRSLSFEALLQPVMEKRTA